VRGAERSQRNMEKAVKGDFDKLDTDTLTLVRQVVSV
jgi:hypothetical protein